MARIYGLENVMAGELVEFPGEIFGMVLNLKKLLSAWLSLVKTAILEGRYR